MKFLCTQDLKLDDGRFWLEGEVYEMTRSDLLALQQFLDYFDPVNEAAQAWVDSQPVPVEAGEEEQEDDR